MRYTIEYQPQISNECSTFIANNIDPIYTNQDTDIYVIDYTYEALSQLVSDNGGEEILGISLQDLSVLKSLIDQGVSYIEF